MKKLLLVLFCISAIGVVSAGAQTCCETSNMKKNGAKYCHKDAKHCEKYCMKYSGMTCTDGMECSMNTASITSPIDTCHDFGMRNGHMGMMRVHRAWCMDSINFSVRSLRQMPYDCMDDDSMWFEVCLHRRDGRLYTTQILVETDQGTLSYDIAMQAPALSDVKENVSAEYLVSVYPNPASDVVHIRLDNAITLSATGELIDAKGTMRTLQVNVTAGEAMISTSNLPTGTYRLILKDGNTIISISDFVLVR